MLCYRCNNFSVISAAFPTKAEAITFTPNFTISSEAAVMINLDKDVTVYEKNPNKKMYPASLTKIMTALIVLDNVEDLDNTVYEAPLVVLMNFTDRVLPALASSVARRSPLPTLCIHCC